MNLAEALKTIREAKGLTIEELATKAAGVMHAGVMANKIEDIELGNLKQPKKEDINAICQALEVQPQLLLFFSLEEKDIAPEKQEVYRQLQGTIKEMILELIKEEDLAKAEDLATIGSSINPDTVQRHILPEGANSPGVIPFKYDGVPFDEDLSDK